MSEDGLRNAVWQALLDAERFGRYYGERAEAHRRAHRILRFILLFAAVGGVARFLNILPAVTAPVADAAGVIIIALVIWDFMADDGKKAAVLHAISIECGEYDLRLRSIWLSLERAEATDEAAVLAELRSIEEGMLRLTARAGYADVSESDRDNRRATEEAYQVVSARFAPEGGGNG